MRLQELTTSLTRSQLGVWAGDTTVRFRGSSSSCFTAWRTEVGPGRSHTEQRRALRGHRDEEGEGDADARVGGAPSGSGSPAAAPSPR